MRFKDKMARAMAYQNKLAIAGLVVGSAPSYIFTAIANTTSHVTFTFAGLTYDSAHDRLDVYDLYSGHLCILTTEYTIGTNSLDLVGWTIGIGEQIQVQLIKGVK